MPFEQWAAEPEACMRCVCDAFGLSQRGSVALPTHHEKKAYNEVLVRHREKAIEMIRLDWDARWRHICASNMTAARFSSRGRERRDPSRDDDIKTTMMRPAAG